MNHTRLFIIMVSCHHRRESPYNEDGVRCKCQLSFNLHNRGTYAVSTLLLSLPQDSIMPDQAAHGRASESVSTSSINNPARLEDNCNQSPSGSSFDTTTQSTLGKTQPEQNFSVSYLHPMSMYSPLSLCRL